MHTAALGPWPATSWLRTHCWFSSPPSILAVCVHRVELSRGIYCHSLNGLLYHSQGLSLWCVVPPDLVSPQSHRPFRLPLPRQHLTAGHVLRAS